MIRSRMRFSNLVGAVSLVLTALAATDSLAKPAEAQAIFAGGCFWCMEPAFEGIQGVSSVIAGYSGGTTKDPTYEQVSQGIGGHYEAVRVKYDPSQVKYQKLLETYLLNVDVFDDAGQFCDKGQQYQAVVFYGNADERRIIEERLKRLNEEPGFKGKVKVLVKEYGNFHPAEDYHQDYSKKNPGQYKRYKDGCGRDRRLKEIWGK